MAFLENLNLAIGTNGLYEFYTKKIFFKETRIK